MNNLKVLWLVATFVPINGVGCNVAPINGVGTGMARMASSILIVISNNRLCRSNKKNRKSKILSFIKFPAILRKILFRSWLIRKRDVSKHLIILSIL